MEKLEKTLGKLLDLRIKIMECGEKDLEQLADEINNDLFQLNDEIRDTSSMGDNIKHLKLKLEKSEQALNDILKWDDELEEIWGDPGNRANSALKHNMSLDGF